MMGKGSSTTTQTTSPNPSAMSAYNNVLNRASNVASQPYVPYTGNLVADVNAQQYQGIGGINANAGFAVPYITNAADYVRGSASPITGADISNYENPYIQNVVQAAENQFANVNAQQQNQVVGNAAAAGALGGDRVGVAQGVLAGQQAASEAPVIAGLYQTGFNQAFQAAEQQRQRQANAGYAMGNLGVSGENAALQGAGAQIGAGTLEQNTLQQLYNALYGQFQIGQAFPYQQEQWLAGIDTGVGSQMGGTSQTIGPPPNPLNALIGAGATVAGAYLGMPPAKPAAAAHGGRIPGFADGGVPGSPYGNAPGYIGSVSGFIPGIQITHGKGAPPAPQTSQASSPFDLAKMGLGLPGTHSHDSDAPSAPIDLSAPGPTFDWQGPLQEFSDPEADLGGIYAHGGKVAGFADGGITNADDWRPNVSAMDDEIQFATKRFPDIASRLQTEKAAIADAIRGPTPIPRPRPSRPGFAGGGPLSFDDRWAPVDEAVKSGAFDPMWDNYPSSRYDNSGNVKPPSVPPTDIPGREFASLDNGGGSQIPSNALAYAGDTGEPVAGLGAPTAPGDASSPSFLDRVGSAVSGVGDRVSSALHSPHVGDALMAAGLGMMASRSPFLGVSIGEGGLAGLQTYLSQKQQDVANKQKQDTLDMQVKRLNQEAKHWQDQLEATTDLRKAQMEQTAEYRKAQLGARTEGWKSTGMTTEDGHPVAANAKGQLLDMQTGQQPTGKVLDPRHQAPFDDDTARNIAERYVTSGNRMVLSGYGRNAQAQGMIAKAVTDTMKEKNITPEEMAHREAEWEGRKAGQRVLGTVEARMTVPAVEATGAIKLARGIINTVPRTSFLPLNKLIEGYKNQTLDPDQEELRTRLQGVRNTYASVMNRGAGTTTVNSQHRADELLNSAGNAEALNRVLDTMLSEINMAVNSPEQVRDIYRKRYGSEAIEPKPAAPWFSGTSSSASKPEPTDKDIAYAKAHPETRDKFIRQFGREP